MVKFIEPTLELIEQIAADMRQADAAEVWASSHATPLEALMRSWEASELSTIVTVNDVPCVMLGLVVRDMLSGAGIPWLLGTEHALKYKREFFKQSPRVVEEMLHKCPRLHNYVHAENTVSIKWLQWIGFTIEKPGPYGPDGELFHHFYLTKAD